MITSKNPASVSVPRKESAWLCTDPCCKTEAGVLIMAEKHGMTGSKIYNAWCGIKMRCLNYNHQDYADYGARGIMIHTTWINNFMNFYNYVSKLPNYMAKGHSLDRIDNDGNYEPGNLRWAENHTQGANRRIQKNNVTGFTGVVLKKRERKYRAQIKIMGEQKHIGAYDTIDEAAIARDKFIIEHNLFEYPLQILNKEIVNQTN